MKCNCGRNEEAMIFPAVWIEKYPEIKGMCMHCFSQWQQEQREMREANEAM
jgi:NMD protein affecting ribosome stability and mRNA decay